LNSVKAISAQDMYRAILKDYPNYDITFMMAAVADYTPADPSRQKIKKSADLNLELKRTKDILKELGEKKVKGQILVGFAAESENIKENALQKLTKKNLNYICANNLKVSGKDDTEIIVLSNSIETKISGDKFYAAHQILNAILGLAKK
jgi:phosphopantothenoylcysteine decarboxylase/phosphopantothenate--cysteine ligase